MPNHEEAENVPEQPRKDKEKEGEGTGPLAVWIALVYGTGLAMNNMFLSQFGIHDFSLVKPKAIFSGAIVLGSIALISAGPLFVIARHIDQRNVGERWLRHLLNPRTWFKAPTWLPAYKGESIGRRTYAYAIARLILPFVLIILVRCLDARRMGHTIMTIGKLIPGLAKQAAWLYVTSCCVATFAIQCIRKLRKIKSVVSFAGIANRFAILSVFLATALISLGEYMILFDDAFYPSIPELFGGPSFAYVQFEVNKEAVDHLEHLGIQFSKNTGTLTDAVEIVYESEDAIYVLPNKLPPTELGAFDPYSGHAIRLDKKLIVGTIVQDNNAPGSFKFGHFDE